MGRIVETTPGIATGRTWVFLVRHSRAGGFECLPLRHRRTVRRVSIPLTRLLERDRSLRRLVNLPPGWTAHRQSPAHHWERNRMPVGPTHYLRFEAVQLRGTDATRRGAFVNCWVRDRSKRRARAIAETSMRKAGWRVSGLEHHTVVERRQGLSAGRRYFDQAQMDGLVLVIHTFPASKS